MKANRGLGRIWNISLQRMHLKGSCSFIELYGGTVALDAYLILKFLQRNIYI